MNQLVPTSSSNVEAYRASTDAAQLCKEIVAATASNIQGKRYVSVEGWEAIARAHGCAAGATNVRRVDGGIAATGEVRDMFTGNIISVGEGFVGEDEAVWFGGDVVDKWGKKKTHPKRADYAIRAMAQTRAISRACRSAFAHVVVLMNAGLETTPAEEVPAGGFDDTPHDPKTGEIIEAKAEPDNRRREPEAREVLEGLHKSKTALRNAIIEGIAGVRACGSVQELDDLLKSGAETIAQAERYWPELLDGNPDIPEDIGLKGAEAQRRSELSGEDSQFSMLITSMKETETKVQLEDWLKLNWPLINSLDDTDRRKWEQAKDWHESAINEMDRAST